MDNKKFNKYVVTSIISSIVLVGLFNYFIDPLDVFHTKNNFNNYKPNIDKNHRISKIPAFKLNKEQINAIWIGSSKTGWSSNEEYEKSTSSIRNCLSTRIFPTSIAFSKKLWYNKSIIIPKGYLYGS